MYYVAAPSEVEVVNNDVNADISWTASTDAEIDGYNVYRRPESGLWEKVNEEIITETAFSDTTVPGAGEYRYMVKATKLKVNGSGSFWNESLGAEGQTAFVASIANQPNFQCQVFPNPSNGQFTVQSKTLITSIEIYAPDGKRVYVDQPNAFVYEVALENLEKGMYSIRIKSKNSWLNKRVMIQ